MTTKILKTIAQVGSILFLIGAGFYIGWQSHSAYGSRPETNRIPSIQEIQTLVGAVPDGKIGSETLRLWNIAICNQEANRWFVKK
jgi:hypothetical protein